MAASFRFAAALAGLTLGVAGLAASAQAAEYPIGKPLNTQAMEIAAVYLQPITMDPEGMMRKASESDIHLEADIKARANNPTGFADDAWVPYLQVHYKLQKKGSNKVIEGDMMAMVANDGPHYGDNVKLDGPGKYSLTLLISPPKQTGHDAFGRHVDKETGVGPWFKPITFNGEFTFAGTGKKGGY
ncbi:iron transporter [Chitinasiproducens palmae]|uniref:34 kDa membrane antigen n=1 Tax=Chitinasiproducens palmae TaxID=1770053 RepID=A0A1H2PSH2_9BURK|nr:iron transporter [Chitinasiproducens palmae]SDV49955.1 hypothetical protein SAMN05216551_1106 [Chitinasiproducens palmae]